MSNINTNGLDTNYPIPGQNNSTQGFRNNFTIIKNNLNTASTEITDLQTKAVLKSALANSTIDNNMANTLIANASTLQFRSTMYNLGNALVDNVLVDCSLGDVQFGNLAPGNTSIYLSFGSWIPTNTYGGIELQLGRDSVTDNCTISFPSQVQLDYSSGWAIVENVDTANSFTTITFPYDVTQLNLKLTSNDCGNTIYVQPLNRPFQSTQIQTRTPPPTGFLGDVAGTVAVDANYLYVCTSTFDSGGSNSITSLNGLSTTALTDVITMSSDVAAAGVTVNMPVIFDTMTIDNIVTSSFGNITEGQVYYVKTISGANITISDTRTSGVAGSTLALSDVTANTTTGMDATFYAGSNIWKRVTLNSW